MHSTDTFNMGKVLTTLRKQRPLIHNITNFVVMTQTANALLALGASPIMAHAPEELPDLMNIAQALVLNMGTLDNQWIASMYQAQDLASTRNTPIILDPVGAGASTLRTTTALDLLERNTINIVRGNAAEIMTLGGSAVESKGVDSDYQTQAALAAARHLARHFQCVCVISGAEDYIVGPSREHLWRGGNPLMTQITGMGCIATALIGACAAVTPDSFDAAAMAMAIMNMAGEEAGRRAQGPGSFAWQFLDVLHGLDDKSIQHWLDQHDTRH